MNVLHTHRAFVIYFLTMRYGFPQYFLKISQLPFKLTNSTTSSAVVVTELYERGAAHALNHSSLSCRLAYSFVASSWFGNNYLQLKSASIRHQRKETTCEEAFFNIIS